MVPSDDLVCVGCGKHPTEIAEYVEAARNDPEFYVNASDYVMREEGTLNPENGHFLCTGCYIASGMPSWSHGWRAP